MSTAVSSKTDRLKIGDRTFTSRLIIGTGKYRSYDEMKTAHRASGAEMVTVAVNRVEFKQPVLVGDVVRFLTRLVRLGRTSITMNIAVEAERDGQVLQVTEAEAVYVGVDAAGAHRRPVPLLP